jgi:hypothetical protein
MINKNHYQYSLAVGIVQAAMAKFSGHKFSIEHVECIKDRLDKIEKVIISGYFYPNNEKSQSEIFKEFCSYANRHRRLFPRCDLILSCPRFKDVGKIEFSSKGAISYNKSDVEYSGSKMRYVVGPHFEKWQDEGWEATIDQFNVNGGLRNES